MRNKKIQNHIIFIEYYSRKNGIEFKLKNDKEKEPIKQRLHIKKKTDNENYELKESVVLSTKKAE
jgi:hypothetical protein